MPGTSLVEMLREDLPHDAINRDLKEGIQAAPGRELERIRRDVRSHFFEGRNRNSWKSFGGFGEALFGGDPELSPRACEEHARRLIDNPIGSDGAPTRDTVLLGAAYFGIAAVERMQRAEGMVFKRELTVLTVVPHLQKAFKIHSGAAPPLPFQSGGPRPEFLEAIVFAGMPSPRGYNEMKEFEDVVDAKAARHPAATYNERYWAAAFELYRPLQPMFDVRLDQVARTSAGRNEPEGIDLLLHIERVKKILSAVRSSFEPQRTESEVLRQAATKLTKHYKVSLNASELSALLRHCNAPVADVALRKVSAAWMIWHLDDARPLAHKLLSG